MKKIIVLKASILAVLVILISILTINIYANDSVVNEPTFSVESGFYDNPFYIEISADSGMDIYYTKDGSTPNNKSIKYTEQIEIKRNEECSNVIKAIAVDASGNSSAVATAEYFVGIGDKDVYKDIPIVTIIADQNELFGRKGIYTKYYREGSIMADVRYYDRDSSTVEMENAEIEIKGAASRSFEQKSFNVKGNTLSFTLSNGGQDNKFKLQDGIVSKLSNNLNYEYSKSVPCQVFIQGEYWGMYLINDRMFSKKYYTAKYGVKKKTISIIKNGELNEGEESDLLEYNNDIAFATSHNLSDDANYEVVCDAFDIDSLVDYYAMEMYINNTDWPINNYAVWRSTEYKDGKWIYILYDTNFPNVLDEYKINMLKRVIRVDGLFKALYNNAEFKEKFLNRYIELINSNLSSADAIPIVTTIYEYQRKYVESNLKKFYPTSSLQQYDERYIGICNFINERASIMLEQITNFDLRNYSGSYGGGGSGNVASETSASASSEASATPTPAIKITKPAIKKIKVGKKSFTIAWKKAKNIDGYQLQYSTKKDFRKSARKTITISKKKTSYTVKKLKAKKKYYVRMRGYKVVDGKRTNSAWTKMATVKIRIYNL